MTPTKGILALIGAVVIGLAIWGGYNYPEAVPAQQAIGSSAGTSFNSEKVAEQVVTTATTTAYSLTNTDAFVRTITRADMALANGVSTSTNYVIKCATSTSASAIAPANTNWILNMVVDSAGTNFGTTTGASGLFMASSSPGITGTSTSGIVNTGINPKARVWNSGELVTCLVTTTVGNANGFDPNMTGFIAFPYRGN